MTNEEAIELLNKALGCVQTDPRNCGKCKECENYATKEDGIEAIRMAIAALEQPTITHEQAIDYLHETGWLQNHDRILTESRVPLKGTWKDFTDEGYVECPFCKSATNCESKEEIDDIHFCFYCGAMLKRGEEDGHN